MVILKVSREIAVAWKTEYYLLLLIGPQVFDDVEQLCNLDTYLGSFFVVVSMFFTGSMPPENKLIHVIYCLHVYI